MIEIRESDTELLLYVPIPEKERAKGIEGRRWDPDRKCWVYPKTRRVYDALIAEFGDDLVPPIVSRPTLNASTQATTESPARTQQLATENAGLREEMARVRESLDRLAQADSSTTKQDVERLNAQLMSRELEVMQLRARLEDLELHTSQLTSEFVTATEQMDRLQAEKDALQLAASAPQPSAQDGGKNFSALLKSLAIDGSGGNKEFSDILDEVKLTGTFPIHLRSKLERRLRTSLNVDDRAAPSLNELIGQARDSGVLSEEGFRMAHLVRVQGNAIAHDAAEPHTVLVRGLLSLYAASLVWPELSDPSAQAS